MFQVEKTYTFDAAHQLVHLPQGHKCRRLHGHSYIVKVMVESAELDHRGMVLDFADLDQIVKPIIEQLDHRFISSGEEEILVMLPEEDVCLIRLPSTAENLAIWLGIRVLSELEFEYVNRTEALVVEVFETPKSSAKWVWQRGDE